MNAPSKKPKPAESVEDVLNALDQQREKNLRIWHALGKTDPKHTKGFSRAGGFKGTAIKPIWIIQRLTEQFGPCGEGWGIGEPQFQVVEANGDVLVYCTVRCWHGEDHALFGVGGDKVAGKNRHGPYTDDEAFKKAFTDAVNNAFKFVGVGADIHMGQFEDSKYLAEVEAEFHPKPDNPSTGEPKARQRVTFDGPYTCPTQLKTAAREFVRTLEGLGGLDELIVWSETTDYREFCAQLERDMPDWWQGGPSVPADFVPLQERIAAKRRELEQLENA